MSDHTPTLPHVEGLTDESGVTEHDLHHGHRIRTCRIDDNWAFAINDAPFQTGDWKDQRATVIAAMAAIDHSRLGEMR